MISDAANVFWFCLLVTGVSNLVSLGIIGYSMWTMRCEERRLRKLI